MSRAIEYIDDEVGTYNGTADLVFPHPGSAVAGDILVVAIACEDGSAPLAPTVPSGWVQETSASSAANGGLWIYTYRVPISPSSTYTWVLAARGELIGVLSCYRASSGSNASSATSASGSDHDAPSITVPRASSWIVCAFCSPSALAWKSPTGMTERHDRQTAIVGNESISLHDEAITEAGATGVKVGELSGGDVAVCGTAEIIIPSLALPGLLPDDPPGGIGLV